MFQYADNNIYNASQKWVYLLIMVISVSGKNGSEEECAAESRHKPPTHLE